MAEDPKFLSADQLLLTTLVVKVAVMAVLATMLVRFSRFRRILLTEQRAWPERLLFAAGVGVPVAAGVAARLLLQYKAADVSLEGALLAGLLAGPYAGALVGLLAGLPAAVAGEALALPFLVGCGLAGGGLREVCPKAAIWHFSPLFFTGLHRHAWRLVRQFEIDWQVALLALPVSLELLRQGLGHRFGSAQLFYLPPTSGALLVLTVLATVLSVAIPIKIWNSARIEHRLEEQEKLLMQARLEALASQINPHFLFNTLASIASLIRSQPETARMLILKLSGLLRRRLRSHDQFVTLREELESIDEYLDIESVRFGPSLTVEKQIEPDTLDVLVPSMILQPLIENSIKHGLGGRVGGGRIIIRSRRENGHAVLEVIDDGVGMSGERLESALKGGIGLSNVSARLQVIYGANYQLTLQSEPGRGTVARMEIPELVPAERATA